MVDRVGQLFGNYRLVRLLGRGGFAEVYLGEHLRLKTQAAIKVLHTSLEDNDAESFLREAQTVARLKHPRIVRVFDFDIEAHLPFLVMDYLPRGNVRRSHPKGIALPLETIVPYVTQVASALQYAHDQKLIHRDVKPENMLLDQDNTIVLSDFGIALMTQSSRSQSIQEVAGTAAYMAPEQFQGHPHRASDQYALGVVVYEWLTGDHPFHGSFSEIASQHLFVPPPPLRERVPMVSPAIEQVVLTALEKDPHKRFASVQAFATALERENQVATILPVTLPTEISMLHQTLLPDNTVAATSLSQSTLPTKAATPPSQSLQATNFVTPPSPLSEPSVAATVSSATMPAKAHSNLQGEEILSVSNSQNTENMFSDRKPESDTAIIYYRRWLPRSRTILLVGLALFVIVSSVGFFSLIRANQIATENAHMNATSIAHAATGTANAAANATATEYAVTAITQANATATTIAQATTIASQNPYPPHRGHLVLDDPLHDAGNWATSSLDSYGDGCVFKGDGFHNYSGVNTSLTICNAWSTDFVNFAYQVQISIVSGNRGGIIFRGEQGGVYYYQFIINRDGSYICTYEYIGTILAQGSSSAIKNGLGQSNLIAIVANASNIDLYVNHQYVTSVTNSLLSHGYIGVAAGYGEAVFTNAKVWAF